MQENAKKMQEFVSMVELHPMQEKELKMQENTSNAGKGVKNAGKHLKCRNWTKKCRNFLSMVKLHQMQEKGLKMQENTSNAGIVPKNAGIFYFPTLFLPKAKKISWELGIMLKFNVNNNFQKVGNYLNFHIK